MQPKTDEKDIGLQLLVVIMVFIGLVIFVFGCITSLSPYPQARITGGIIMAIGILDFIGTYFLRKHLLKP